VILSLIGMCQTIRRVFTVPNMSLLLFDFFITAPSEDASFCGSIGKVPRSVVHPSASAPVSNFLQAFSKTPMRCVIAVYKSI